MITYILESLAFQLVFLLTYDLFLKKETFFQWNRVYLLGTFVLSLILPWVKIEALKTTMPQELGTTTVFLTQLDGVVLGPRANEASFLASIPWPYWVLAIGCLIALFWFVYKLIRLNQLRNKGSVTYYNDFTKISVPKSTVAFSFFRNIFLGADIKKEKESNILAHELVHVKQFHSLDLIFFELARVFFWFNPLVYIYQNRMAELHEFIADAQAVKQNKTAHFDMLLSEVFNTQNISFVNQFFNRSLIKKRIVMLQKKKSKAVWQLKYVVMFPLVLGMLMYSSCEKDSSANTELSNELSLEERLAQLNEEIKSKDSLTAEERDGIAKMAAMMANKFNASAVIRGWTVTTGVNTSEEVSKGIGVPFDFIEKVPIFPGCENAEDKKLCFMVSVQEHIRKHFRYPEEAKEQGIEGKVFAEFIVDSEGNVGNVKMHGPSPILMAEAQRIIDLLPKMQPGTQRGKVVYVPFSIPITFKL